MLHYAAHVSGIRNYFKHCCWEFSEQESTQEMQPNVEDQNENGTTYYLHKAKQTQETNIHFLSRFRIRDPSNQATSDQRLRPHVHRHWLQKHARNQNTSQ